MKNAKHLTHAQIYFLYAVRDRPATLQELSEGFKLKPWLLSKWLRKPAFRQALAEVLKELRAKHKLEFELAARKATDVMSRIVVGGEGNHLVRQTSFDLLDLYFTRRAPGRKVMKLKNPPPPRRPLIHPDVPPEEAAEHLEALEGRQGAD
jgi:hypothetical protein